MVLESNTLDVLFVKDGQQGEDGKILYTWIKYAKDASGTGMTDDPNGAIYIGISYNNESSIESNDPTQYAWTKIQGADGKKGEDAYTIFLENENISFATDKNRNPLSEQAYTSGITIMKGAKPVTDFTIGDIAKTQGIAVAKTDTAIAISVVNGNSLPNDSGEIEIPITVDGTVFKKILTWTCAKKGDQGEKGEQGIQGPQGEQGIAGKDGTSVTITNKSITYQLSTSGTTIPTGTWQTSPQTIPEGQYQWTKTSVTYSDGNKTESYSISYHGKNGSNGTSVKTTSTSVKYQVGDSGTTKPTGTWQANVPTVVQGKYLWTQTIVNYSDGNSTESYSVAYRGIDGNNGVNGMNAATIYLYQRATSTPNKPSNTLTYTFSTTKITGTLNNGWSTAIPTGTDAVYVTVASVSSKNDTATIATSAWSAPVVLAQNGKTGSDGKAGLNVATIYLYQRNTSKPSKPSASVTYTFSTGVASGLNNGWSQKIPDGTNPLYVTLATASSNTATDTILSSEWSDVVVMAQNGEDGISPKVSLSKSGNTTTISIIDATGTHTQTVKDGTNGTPGAAGKDGKTSYFHVKYSNDGGKTFTSNSGEDTGIYMGSYTDYTETDSTDVKKYNWVKVKGDKGDTGQKGQNAKNLSITPSSQYFKSTDGGKTFAPNTITIKPTIQGEISFGKWQYSIDGGVSFADIVSGQKGLTINNNVLTVSKDSSLYSDGVTMVTFRAVANDSSFYDTCSIAKIYDVSDIGDGRNLLTGVSSYTKDTPFEKTDSRADGWTMYQNIITSIELEAGKKYVLQAKTDGNWAANHDTNGQDSSKKLVTLWLCSDKTNNCFDMRQGYAVFTPTVTAKYKLRVNQYSNGTDAYTIHLWDIKLEKGSSPTGWTPAPEDLQTAILSTKSEISDVSLKVDKNKQAIEQRVEKTTYQQDLNLVKGDISKANEGLNKWRYEIYPKSLFASEYQGKSTMDVFAKNTNLTPSQSVLINDTDFGKSWAYGDNYIGYALTFVKFSAAKSIAITFKHDDGAHLYLNGKLIGGDDTCNTGSGESLTLSFIQGWNCLEVVLNEKSGGEYIGLGTTISAISECQLMNCYYGTPVARQSHITNQLVQNTTDIDGVSTKVSKVTSVIGDNGENFTSFKNDYSDFKQTMNGFKTTVGQTYVTKDDFNGLEIGGRNLVRLGGLSSNGATSFSYDKTTDIYTIVSPVVSTVWGIGAAVKYDDNHKVLIPYGKTYILSFEVKVPQALSINIDINNFAVSGSSWAGNDNDDGSMRGQSSYNIPANTWTKVWVRWANTNTKNTNKVDLYDNSSIGLVTKDCTSAITWQIRHVKGELGNKPTDWTPAPEDVNGKIVNVETIANQTAKKFEWIVKGGDSSSNFTLTDRVADLVAERINFKGLVTFSGLNTDAKNEIGKVAQSKVDGLEIGGRNLARGTSNEYSTPYTNFTGSANTCFDIGRVYLDNLKVGNTITVHMYIKYDNLVAASGKTIQIWLQGYGNVTLWDGGNFPSTLRPTLSGSGVYELLYSVVLSKYHVKNEYWACGIRTDYIQSGSVQVKSFKVEKGNKATDWTPAPEDYLPQASLVSNWTTNTTWIDGGKIYTNSITADKIATDAIKSRNYISSGGTQGSFLNLSDGSFTSPNLSWDSNGNLIAKNANLSGQINATKGTVGGWNIATNGLYSGIDENAIKIYSATTYDAQTMYQKQKIQDSFILSQKYINHFVSQQVSVGHNIPYWQTRSFIYNDSQIQLAQSDYCINTSSASNYDAQYSLKDGYISATRIYMEQNITQVGGDVINSSFSIGLDSMMGWCSIQSTKGINIYGNSSRALYVQSNDTSKYNALETEGDVVVNGKIHAVSGDNKIQLNSDNNGSIELYGNTPFIDFHSAYSSADYTCRIIANTPEQLLVCGKLRCDSNIISNNDLIANSWVYAGQNAHYTWQNQLDCYFSCGYYNNTNNVYYYAGYHAFYVNNDSGSGMMYINTNGVTSRVGFTKTSDERIKKNFESFDDNIIDAYMNIEPVKYQLKQSSNDNYHFGFKAQHVDKVFSDYGDTYNESFDICTSRPIDPDKAKELYGVDDMTEEYGLRYDELIAPTTYMVQHIYKELESTKGELAKVKQEKADLETRLQAIEAKLRL